MRDKSRFLNALVYVLCLLIINIILIYFSTIYNSKKLLFWGNILAISFVFPMIILYFEKKEPFKWKRYIYFTFLTFVVMFMICNLFIYRLY